MNTRKINRVSRNLILGTSRATRGAYYNNMDLQKSADPDATRADIVIALKKTSWFERLWYPIFFILGLLCLIFIRPFTFELCFSVLSLFLYMFANNLLARGKLIGLILSIISSSLYSIVSFFAKVYGEVIINVLLYIPLDIIAVITFKKNKSETNDVEIRQLSAKNIALIVTSTIAITLVTFLVLYFLPGNIWTIVLNSLSISLFLMALLVRNYRFKEFWWFNLLGNLVSLAMWGWVSTSAELIYSLPFAISSLAALLNNIYGIILWQKMYKKERTNGGIYVKRTVKINRVIKVRRRYQSYLKWDREVEEKRALKNKVGKRNG